MASVPDCAVLVVGLGPVGTTLAALLTGQGIATIAVERETTPYALPRAVHFDHEIMRLFQHLGIAEAVASSSAPARRYEFRSPGGQLLFAADPVPEAPSGWNSGYMFHQPGLERTLRAHLASLLQSDMRLGCRFEGLSQDESGVSVTLTSMEGRTTLRSRYLVACDGASSPVRETVGGGLFDYGFDEPWLVIDAILEPSTRVPDVNLQLCDPERPTTCVSSGPGRHRWEFMMLPGETPEVVLKEEFIRGLLERWGCATLRIERKAVYRFHGLVAKRWRVGRVLLAGDAAHQMPPFDGQGMCSGMRDAANLAWKLEAVLTGQADEALLDTYQSEREPHIRTIIERSIAMGRMVCTLDKTTAAARDQSMLARQGSGARPPSLPRASAFAAGCILPGSPGAGDLFPQPTSEAGSQRLRLDDVMGRGPWLISLQPLVAPRCTGLTVHHLAEASLAPFHDALAGWLETRSVQAVLVRPDRYVFGSGEPQALLAAWTQSLHPSDRAATRNCT